MNMFTFKRAAVLAALFSLSILIPNSLVAQKKNSKSETYKDIIEKAYNLSLQKDRQQAINILIAASKKESRNGALIEIHRAINEISHVLISDKAQQAYEAGLSLRKSDLQLSIIKLNEAFRIEPDNLAIIEDLARNMISKGDCASASDVLVKQIKMLNYDEEFKLTLAQSYVCQSLWSDYGKLLDGLETHRIPLQKYWLNLEIEKNFKLKNLSKSQEYLNNMKKVDSKYPGNFYWSWKISSILKHPNLEEAQKYISTCKNISLSQLRQYMIDPTLCRHLQEVEVESKGSSGNND